MQKIIFSSFVMVFLYSCSSMTLKPLEAEKRTLVKVENISMSQIDAFDATQTYLSKAIKDSNHAIEMKDRVAGKIVAKINFNCNGLKRPDLITSISSTDVNYIVDVAFKDKKVRIEVVMEGFTRTTDGLGTYDSFNAQADGQEGAVKKCNEQLIDNLIKGITAHGPAW